MSVAEREKHSKVKHIEKSSRHESHESRCYCSGLGLVSKNTPLCFFVNVPVENTEVTESTCDAFELYIYSFEFAIPLRWVLFSLYVHTLQ